MNPGKSNVGKNPRLRMDVKSKQGISRIPLSKKVLNEIRLRRLHKKLDQK